MSTRPAGNRSLWLKNPYIDVAFYSCGWILILAPLLLYQEDIYQALFYSGSFAQMRAHPEYAVPAITVLVVLVINYVHRHLTFALVYGEKDEFMSRRKTYIALPVVFACLTVAFVHLNLFVILLTLSVVWTMYHSVAQKYGLTRIYSRKAGYGSAWIERGIIFSWFAWLVMALADREKETILKFNAGRTLMDHAGWLADLSGILSALLLVVAIAFTLIYLAEEFRNRVRISIPKNLFVLSVLCLYTIFLYDLMIGYIVFAFSHALEYTAFVNMYVKKKYQQRTDASSLLSRASKHLWIYSGLFSVLIVGLCLTGMNLDGNLFSAYIVGSSFLHFLYDGWIWKLRKPDVGKPLDIGYAAAR